MTKKDDDIKQQMRDGVGELLAQVAAGEISEQEARRELDICKALAEMIRITAELIEMQGRPDSPEGKMRLEAALIGQWPEACRRADVAVHDELPIDIVRRIAGVGGRSS